MIGKHRVQSCNQTKCEEKKLFTSNMVHCYKTTSTSTLRNKKHLSDNLTYIELYLA